VCFGQPPIFHQLIAMLGCPFQHQAGRPGQSLPGGSVEIDSFAGIHFLKAFCLTLDIPQEPIKLLFAVLAEIAFVELVDSRVNHADQFLPSLEQIHGPVKDLGTAAILPAGHDLVNELFIR
jgi:hypothetical protein